MGVRKPQIEIDDICLISRLRIRVLFRMFCTLENSCSKDEESTDTSQMTDRLSRISELTEVK